LSLPETQITLQEKHIGETVDGFRHNFTAGSKKIQYVSLSHFSLITSFNSVIYHTTLIVKIEKEKGCQFRQHVVLCGYLGHKSVFSLVNSAVNMILTTFAAERRAAALGARRFRSISPARTSSKPAAAGVDRWDRQTD